MAQQSPPNSKKLRLERDSLDSESRKLVDDFDKALVMHRNLKAANETLEKAILNPGNRRVIVVLGPAGAGKTTLLEMVDASLWKRAANDPNWNKGHLPTGHVEMRLIPNKTHSTGIFSWEEYFVDALEAFHELLIPYKKRIKYTDLFSEGASQVPKLSWRSKGVTYDEEGSLWISKDAKTNGLYFALIDTLYFRQPYCFLNDEAHHLLAINSGQSLLNQMNAIKSLSNLSGTVIVLFGIYEMALLLHLNDQLSRRIRVVEFSRYNAAKKADIKAFNTALGLFEKTLPVDAKAKLLPNHLWIYERTCGLIGILKDWLLDALVCWLSDKSQTFMDALVDTAPPDIEVVKRALAIQAGEELFYATKEQMNEARGAMGLANKNIKAPKKSRNGVGTRVGIPKARNYPSGDLNSLRDEVPDDVAP